jgi:hypothetical protein
MCSISAVESMRRNLTKCANRTGIFSRETLHIPRVFQLSLECGAQQGKILKQILPVPSNLSEQRRNLFSEILDNNPFTAFISNSYCNILYNF